MSNNYRLIQHPHLSVQRGKELTFYADGRTLRAYEGETVGAALHAAGVKIFSRSVKYHRPRGLFCVAGNCPNCLMQVNGVPNVRTCIEPVRDGMDVRTQSGWPSAKIDIFSVLDYLGFLFPVGFPYRYFIRPRWLYHWWEWLLRQMSGHGILSPPRPLSPISGNERKLERHTDVAIVGGGPAGLTAAQAAASTGLQVALIDEGVSLGGSLRADTTQYTTLKGYPGLRGYEIVERLEEGVAQDRAVQIYTAATAFGLYDGGVLGIRQKDTLTKLTAKRIIVATGAYENSLPAEDCDRPGVLLATAVQRMLHLWKMRPGKAAVVVTSNDFGLVIAAQLLDANVAVKAVADARAHFNESRPEVLALRGRHVPLLSLHTLKAVKGRAEVRGATLVPLNSAGQTIAGAEIQIPCDTIVLSAGFYPANELLFQATARGSYVLESTGTLARVPYREDDMCVEEGLHVAGNAAGVSDKLDDLATVLLEGEIAGLSAALSLGAGGAEAEGKRRNAQQSLAAARGE